MRAIQFDPAHLESLLSQGLTHKEIGKVLGCSETWVERRVKRLGLQSSRTGPRAGEGHYKHWLGGRGLDKHGYVSIWCPLHPTSNHMGRIQEHRLVMEVVLSRYLEEGEVVDHEDGHPRNNWPANLRLFASNGEHLKAELTGRPKASRRYLIPGACLSTRKLPRCPDEIETLAQCSSEIRLKLASHIENHRPTTEHRMLSLRAFLRQGALQPPFAAPSKA